MSFPFRSFLSLTILTVLLLCPQLACASGPAGSPGSGADSRWLDGYHLPEGCDGPVNAVVELPTGSLVFGGSFRTCGDQVVNGVARYEISTGTWWPLGYAGGAGVDGEVHSLALFQGDLYVGGRFVEVNQGSPSPTRSFGIARWDGTQWHPVGGGVVYSLPQEPHWVSVNVLLATEDRLFMGGNFVGAINSGGAVTARGIAYWDGGQFFPLQGILGQGVAGTVGALLMQGDDLFVGGMFSSVDVGGPETVDARNLARWNGSVWSPVGPAGNGVEGAVNALAWFQGSLHVAGEFQSAGMVDQAVPAARIAAWNGVSWAALGTGSGGVSWHVRSLLVDGDTLLVGGPFSEVDIGSPVPVPAVGLARWNGSAWSAPERALSGGVYAMCHTQTGLLAAGIFSRAEGSDGQLRPANRIARWSVDGWTALSVPGGLGSNGAIRAILAVGDHLYVGGGFTRIGGINANGVAMWDGKSWNALGHGGGTGIAGGVWALAYSDGVLYVGGQFNRVNANGPEVAARGVARWDGSAWSALQDPGGGIGVAGDAFALAILDGHLYVGGQFQQAGVEGSAPISARYVARWNGQAWHALGSGSSIANGTSGPVHALAVMGGALYVGGAFSSVASIDGSLTAHGVARWSGSLWSTLGKGNSNGLRSGTVFALVGHQGQLYAAGSFSQATAGDGSLIQVSGIARWNGMGWQGLGFGGGDGGFDPGRFSALASDGGHLYAGGWFGRANAIGTYALATGNIARWNGTTWSRLGRGTDAWVHAIARTPDGRLHVGGEFAVAGGKASRHLAVHAIDDASAFLDVEIETLEAGQVTSDPPGINCPGTCTAAFPVGAQVSLVASAPAGSRFLGWAGAECPGPATCTIGIVTDTQVKAGFATPEGRSLRFRNRTSLDQRGNRVMIPLQTPERPANVGADDMTIELYLRADSQNAATTPCADVQDAWTQGNLIVNRDNLGVADHGRFGLSLMDGRLAFGVTKATQGTTACGVTDLRDNRWHHVAVTRRASDGLIELWLDGELEASAGGPAGDVSYRQDRPRYRFRDPYLELGGFKWGSSSTRDFSGWIDELRISRVRRYSAAFPPPPSMSADAETVLLFRFDEGAGSLLFDESGHPGGGSHGAREKGGIEPGPCWSRESAGPGGLFDNDFEVPGCPRN